MKNFKHFKDCTHMSISMNEMKFENRVKYVLTLPIDDSRLNSSNDKTNNYTIWDSLILYKQ